MAYYLVRNGHLRLVWNLHLCHYPIYSNNCTMIRYNNILTCGNPATCFGQFQGGVQQKYTMASYVIGVHLAVNDINVFIVVMELSWKCSSWFPLHCC
jgi:predicted phosphohydrolase